MNSSHRISEGEWEVMEVLWRQTHPSTALQIVQAIRPHHDWQDTTIRTMIGRLVQKEAVGYTATGKTYFYRPLVTREACVDRVSESFLERVFAGATGPLVLHFVRAKKLTPSELTELEAILKAAKTGETK